MKKRRSGSKNSNDIFIIDCDEDVDEEGFSEKEVPVGKIFASFNFSNEPAQIKLEDSNKLNTEATNKLNANPPNRLNGEVSNKINTGVLNKSSVEVTDKLIDNRKLQTKPYGITPPVDGEHFDITRTFLFRRSTVKMLNRLKAEHKDENVYLSTLVDEALRFYYKHVFEGNKSDNKNAN